MTSGLFSHRWSVLWKFNLLWKILSNLIEVCLLVGTQCEAVSFIRRTHLLLHFFCQSICRAPQRYSRHNRHLGDIVESVNVTFAPKLEANHRAQSIEMDSKLFAAIVVTLSYVICAIECNISGIYVDNGASQMVKHESISFDDIQAMKYEISIALGLPAHRSNVVWPLRSNR